MEVEKNVFIVWKNLGETPLEALKRFRKQQGISVDSKMTYAGRLDPMAEGKLVVLVGDAVHMKDAYNQKNKSYVVEILVGFTTDTGDLLGKVVSKSDPYPETGAELIDLVRKTTAQTLGVTKQQYPIYSSKPVQGKPLFCWARNNRLDEIEIPSHEVRLDDVIVNTNFSQKSGEELCTDIIKKIGLVSGDFRQQEIGCQWNDSVNKKGNYIILTMKIKTGPGFYVRQFVKDISDAISVPLVVYSICRDEICV